MAPFGKGFLKARLKDHRTKEAPPTEGKELQVTVSGQEKVVCGVTRHTTCADVVQALLEEQRGSAGGRPPLQGGDGSAAADFCLVERWKGLERALPPLTRILRLWTAWGDQQPLIRFLLVRISDLAPPGRKAKAKGARPKRGERGPTHPAPPAERQKRMVKKAFRKLERLHRAPRGPPGAPEVDRMVQLILAQDHTLREQGRRLRDLDADLELCADPGGPPPPDLDPDPGDDEGVRRYLCAAGEDLHQLELQVRTQQDLILQLSQDIHLELEVQQLEGAAAGPGASAREAAEDSFYAAELERVRAELGRSVRAGAALHRQVSQLDRALQQCESAAASQDQECWRLASQLGAMTLGCAGGEGEEPGVPGPSPPDLNSSVRSAVAPVAVSLKHGSDTDSDTGISSTHSQDSLSPCLEGPSPRGHTDV